MILSSRSVARRSDIRSAWLVAAVVLLVGTGCSQQQEPATARTAKPAAQGKAHKQYLELCAACHGMQARGGVGPDLTATRFKYGKTKAALEKSIAEGRSGGMPAFSSHLKPEEISLLADYLLSL